MSKIFSISVSKLEYLQNQSIQSHESMINYIENIDSEPLNGTSKIAIEISTLEELAAQVSNFLSLEKEKKVIIDSFKSTFLLLPFQSLCQSLKSQLKNIKLTVKQQTTTFKADIKRLRTVLKEYKERCRNTLVYYLKTLDHDIRKILKPLVPNNVLNEQIKYPYINKNNSLIASIPESLNNSGSVSKVHSVDYTNDKNNNERSVSHIDLLVGTLEKIAKDLISILLETNAQYYDVVNYKEACSHPPTPLAAPLPEYFVYETEEADNPSVNIIKIKEDPQKWIQRFKQLYKKNVIDSTIYKILLDNLYLLESNKCKIDLQDIFKDIDVSADIKESITFALVNKSAIEQHDVTLFDLLSADEKAKQDALKPEPPKNANPRARQRPYVAKQYKKSFDLEQPSNMFTSVDAQENEIHKQSPLHKYRISVVGSKKVNRRSQSIEKNDKSIRFRSVTPVYTLKDKASPIPKTKPKYPKKIREY
jgi:hypothetical protein